MASMYTAFGSGVSTEMWGEDQWIMFELEGYTAFGSGVSTEIRPERQDRIQQGVHSLRLRGEH